MKKTSLPFLRRMLSVLSLLLMPTSLCNLCILCVSVVSARQNSKITTHRPHIENIAALEKFFQALATSQTKQRIDPVRIMHFGDSHVAADVLTREIRERFQADFGDGGVGFIVPRNP